MARRGVSSRASQGWAKGKRRNGYPIAGEMDRWSRERSGHALRGAISRDLGLLIICAWNGIACIRSGGVRLVRIYICVYVYLYVSRALTYIFALSLASFLHLFFLSRSLSLSLFLYALWINIYIYAVLTRVHEGRGAPGALTRPSRIWTIFFSLPECIFVRSASGKGNYIHLLQMLHFVSLYSPITNMYDSCIQ